MGKLINVNKREVVALENRSETGVVQIAEKALADVRADIENKATFRLPVAQLATLGAGVASLLPAFRTVTQTTAMHADGLFRLVNAGAGETLKVAKNGNFWGALKKLDGGSKMAQLQSASSVPATMTTTMPVDPSTLMIAAALYSIEQKLDSILETQKQILSFLQIEKEAKIEADLEELVSMIEQYKFNWDNADYVADHRKQTVELRGRIREIMLAYQKQVSNILNTKKLFVSQAKVNETLNDLLRKFKYYKLSLFVFSLATFTQIMLNGKFKEESIRCFKEEIEKLAMDYRELYSRCSVYLESMSGASIEANVLKGIGIASSAVGKFVENIPKISDGQIDEFLQDSGKQLEANVAHMERKTVAAFAEISDPGVGVFTEKMEELIRIYGRTQEIYFDDKQIYFVAG